VASQLEATQLSAAAISSPFSSTMAAFAKLPFRAEFCINSSNFFFCENFNLIMFG
jgi:hypothetical protein